MAKISNQNMKMLWLHKILFENTSENHPLSLKEIKTLLEEQEIMVTEQTLRMDIKSLLEFGLDIITVNAGKNTRYFLGSRQFELAELKILSDCIQSSRSVSQKKTDELIKKIECLTSLDERETLHRQIYISGRAKITNEQIWYSVNEILKAISEKKPITFQYLQWNMQKQLESKRGGEKYEVSPWSLIYDDECYYMVAFDHKNQMIKHYRVDKMKQIEVLQEKERQGLEAFGEEDIAIYSQRHFGMFGGNQTEVVLRCRNEKINIILDRFGERTEICPVDGDYFETKITVAMSDVFIGWVIGLGNGIEVIGPTTVVETIRKRIGDLQKQYMI